MNRFCRLGILSRLFKDQSHKSGLAVYWDFEEGSGTAPVDRVGDNTGLCGGDTGAGLFIS